MWKQKQRDAVDAVETERCTSIHFNGIFISIIIVGSGKKFGIDFVKNKSAEIKAVMVQFGHTLQIARCVETVVTQ